MTGQNRALPSNLTPLVDRAVSGCPTALAEVLHNFRPYLKSVAQRRLAPRFLRRVDASDLTQDCLLDVARGVGRFRGRSSGQFRAWLKRILLNHISDTTSRHIRQLRQEQQVVGGEHGTTLNLADTSEADPIAVVERKEDTDRLQQAISRLPLEYQWTIRWRNHDGLSFPEIAQRLGRSEEAARKIWVRALRQLYQALKRRRGSES